MQVRDVMTTDVETVRADETVSDVLLRMGRAEYNGFPVLDDRDALVGIVTQGDLVSIFQPSGRTFWIPVGLPPFLESVEYGVKLPWDDLDVELDLARNADKPVSEFMTRDVVTVAPDDDLDVAIEILAGDEPDINRLPVVGREARSASDGPSSAERSSADSRAAEPRDDGDGSAEPRGGGQVVGILTRQDALAALSA